MTGFPACFLLKCAEDEGRFRELPLRKHLFFSCESIITRENFARLGTNIKPFGQPDQFVSGVLTGLAVT